MQRSNGENNKATKQERQSEITNIVNTNASKETSVGKENARMLRTEE